MTINNGKNNVSTFGDSQKFYVWCIYEYYSQHEMTDPPFTFGEIFYLIKKDINWCNLCYHYCVSISVRINLLGNKL